VACFAKEAEVNHPELLALPDDVEICQKAAGYGNLSLLLKIMFTLIASCLVV